ncbi:MAG TPA: antibiotic biosynthesis monooxygenase [Nitrososphaera sp.]|nr:antibiotic biosynthesis monooxygenase [Nitrososphaera sp.]
MVLHHTNGHTDDENNGPVTVIVTRKARKGKIDEFEEWMDGIIHEAMKFEGHMGVNIIRPSNMSNPEYIIIFRFDTLENLAKWEKSEIRRQWIEKSKDVTEGEPTVEKQSGLEFWFTPNSGNVSAAALQQPPRYKMAMIVTGVIFVLVSTLLPQIRNATASLPVLLSTLAGVVIMVLLMTYVIMPSVTRLLRPWLSKKRLF